MTSRSVCRLAQCSGSWLSPNLLFGRRNGLRPWAVVKQQQQLTAAGGVAVADGAQGLHFRLLSSSATAF
ncbi:hypothetical protein SK128_024064, partial [Halocaridina rubra]